MKNILLWIWQFPQNILALILIGLSKRKEIMTYNLISREIKVYFVDTAFNCGVSLGNYILLDYKNYYTGRFVIEQTVRHENGHQKQSQYLGIFYLFAVGLPSITRNIIDRLFHKKWAYKDRIKWYYSHYPENWADKLGRVIRNQ